MAFRKELRYVSVFPKINQWTPLNYFFPLKTSLSFVCKHQFFSSLTSLNSLSDVRILRMDSNVISWLIWWTILHFLLNFIETCFQCASSFFLYFKKCKGKHHILRMMIFFFFSSVWLLSHDQLFVTPWTIALQASLSTTNSWSLPKLMSIATMMPSNHLILCHHLLLPSIILSIRFVFFVCLFFVFVFIQMSQLFASDGQSIEVPASISVLPMNTQDWFTLGWTG